MTVEDLLFFAKGHIHSDHAKILIAELLGCNPLELLNHLEEEVPEEKTVKATKKASVKKEEPNSEKQEKQEGTEKKKRTTKKDDKKGEE